LPAQCVTTSLDIQARALHVALITSFPVTHRRSPFGVATKMGLPLQTSPLVISSTTHNQNQLTNKSTIATHKQNKDGYIKYAGRNYLN
jgi:hypothetical protein